MTDQQVVLRIGPDGTIHAETHGMVGPTCLDSIEVLEDVLGARTTASEYTWEYAVADQEYAAVDASAETDDELRLA